MRKKKEKLRVRNNAWYGWVPDLPDRRDWLYGEEFKRRKSFLSKVDLRGTCSPVEIQGELGSCIACALAGALEFLECKDGVPYVDISRLFIYYNARVILKTVDTDEGAMPRDGIKTLAKVGACSEKLWPYVISKFREKPPASCYRDAAKHQITSYYRIQTLNEMRSCLAEGFPFVFGFVPYESFESSKVERAGVLNMPKSNELPLAGHVVLAVGYNDKQKRFLVRNSWGPYWGMQGYFTMPYKYLENRDLSDDFWTIRRAEGI
jgi:C1A family cysteine protease